MTAIIVLAVSLLLATAAGLWWRSRQGVAVPAGASRPDQPRPGQPGLAELLAEAGAPAAQVSVMHFSADWCGPCAAVRRVVAQVAAAGDIAGGVADVEVDIDAHPALASALGVLSLPTTFIFDATGTQRFRIPGVPTVRSLSESLASL